MECFVLCPLPDVAVECAVVSEGGEWGGWGGCCHRVGGNCCRPSHVTELAVTFERPLPLLYLQPV